MNYNQLNVSGIYFHCEICTIPLIRILFPELKKEEREKAHTHTHIPVINVFKLFFMTIPVFNFIFLSPTSLINPYIHEKHPKKIPVL